MNIAPQRKPTIEEVVLGEFKRKSQHLQRLPATTAMQKELVAVCLPFHEKLKELGYPPAMAKAMLGRAFNHQPPVTVRSLLRLQKLKIFN